jgi:hypothetical protein
MNTNAHRSRRRGIVAAALGIGTTAVLLVAGGSATGGESETAAPSSVIATLRAPATLKNAASPSDRAELAGFAESRGLALSSARAVPAPDGDAFLLANDDTVCVTIPDPVEGFGGACGTTADVEDGKLWTGLTSMPGQGPGDARIAVVVPDGVTSVDAVDTNGASTPVTVTDNVAIADLEDVSHYEFDSGGTTVTQDIAGTPPAGAPTP